MKMGAIPKGITTYRVRVPGGVVHYREGGDSDVEWEGTSLREAERQARIAVEGGRRIVELWAFPTKAPFEKFGTDSKRWWDAGIRRRTFENAGPGKSKSRLGAFTSNADLDRFRYVFRKKQDGVALSVYDGKKLIGKVGAITAGNCYTDDDPTMVKYRRPANVVSAEILEEYRGKKLYQEMLLRFRKYAKEELGCKGLKSKGFQRSAMATRAWEKVADRFDVDEWGRRDFFLDGLGKVLDPAEGYRIKVEKTVMTNFYEPDPKRRYYDLFVVRAYDKEGRVVGSADAAESGGGLEVGIVQVKHTHRRKGIASAMYRELEAASGLKMKPSIAQTEEGRALWSGGSSQQKQFGALPKAGRIPMPKGLGASASTKKIAEEWVRDTIANMLKERRLPVLGPGYSDEQRAEAAVESIIRRKTSYAMTLPQSRFWREAKKQLDARVRQRVERDNLEFEQEEAGRSSLRELRREEIERELRSGKYKGKSGAFIDKVIESAVQERLRSENLAGLPKTGHIPMATVRRALKSLGRKAAACGITPASLRLGMEVEREHRDVTRGGVLKTAKIAAAHLCEAGGKRYYLELKKLERKLKRRK